MESSDTVDALLHLQEMDEELGKAREEIAALEAELEEAEEELEGLERRAAERRSQLETAETELRKAERTTQAGRATFKRLQERANEVVNMRQHLAARAEVDQARRNLEAAEEAALEGMERLERARAATSEAEEALQARQDSLRTRREEIESRLDELRDAVAVQSDRRENRALRIDARVRQLYDTVRGGRARDALAPILDGVCGHCFTAIPLQRQAEIRAGRELIVCETCGVILHPPRESDG